MCPPPSISPLHSTFCLLPHHPLEFKQQRICPLSLGFGTLGRNPSSSPRQKTVATRLSSPCLSFSGTLPCPAPCSSFRLRDFSRKLLQDELEALLFALPWGCRLEPGQTSIGRKCTSSSTSCPRPLCTARNRHGNTEWANKYQCLPFQRMPHPVSKYTSPSISSAAIRYSTSDMPPTLTRPSCSHTLNKAEQNPISTKRNNA